MDYALALTHAIKGGTLPAIKGGTLPAIKGGTLPASVEKELAGLLHDLVWLLNEFVKEPYITVH